MGSRGTSTSEDNTNINTTTNTNTSTETTNKSIDHKRVQYRAKETARKATIQNRSVPPLRPNVLDLLANEFPNLEFVANGGVSSMAAVRERIYNRPTHGGVIGAMVGRAAINDPCSFATADSLWDNTAPTTTNNPNRPSDPSTMTLPSTTTPSPRPEAQAPAHK